MVDLVIQQRAGVDAPRCAAGAEIPPFSRASSSLSSSEPRQRCAGKDNKLLRMKFLPVRNYDVFCFFSSFPDFPSKFERVRAKKVERPVSPALGALASRSVVLEDAGNHRPRPH